MDVNGVDYDGRSALHIAASNRHISTYKLLLCLGADPTVRDRRGLTPADLLQADRRDTAEIDKSHPGSGGFSIHRYFAGGCRDGVRVERVLEELAACGLDSQEPTLQEEVTRLLEAGADGVSVTKDSLVVKALCGKMQVPNWSWFVERLQTLSTSHPQVTWSLKTSTQQTLSSLIDDERFPVSSLIRPVLYCAAVELCGLEEVHRWVGKEPSGESQDTLRLLKNKLPYNPFVMAGVLALCGLILKHSGSVQKATRRVVALWLRLAGVMAEEQTIGGEEVMDEATDARIRCVAYMLTAEKRLPENPCGTIEEVVELFRHIHSLQVNSREVAAVAATLARGGDEVIPAETTRQTLSLMFSCGADEMSGEWAFKIGVPAKLDIVNGRAMIVVPKVMGLFVGGRNPGRTSEVMAFMNCLEQSLSFHMFRRHDLVTGNAFADPALFYRSVKHELVSRLLFTAAKGDLQTVKSIISIPGFDCNWADYDNRSALHLAAVHGHVQIVQFLLSIGASADARDRWDATPLQEALREGNDEVERLLRESVHNNSL
jgi:glutaminase/ankyrin repeat protein